MDASEYERRRCFSESLKGLSREAAIEIARILRKHEVKVSENRSGIFFDMSKIDQEVFDEIVAFYDFMQRNAAGLEAREPKDAISLVE